MASASSSKSDTLSLRHVRLESATVVSESTLVPDNERTGSNLEDVTVGTRSIGSDSVLRYLESNELNEPKEPEEMELMVEIEVDSTPHSC